MSNKKIKIFTTINSSDALSDEVNQWIEKHDGNILDISHTAGTSATGNTLVVTVMVTYTDKIKRTTPISHGEVKDK